MKHKIRKFWIWIFSGTGAFILAACVSQTPTSVITATVQEIVAEPTFTINSPSDTPELQPSATFPEPTSTQTEPALSATATSAPTTTPIACDGVFTSAQQEGPYFSPGSPERSSLIDAGMPGMPVLILGRVFDQDCNPIPGAKLDFWLADVNGEYDHVGYTLRGHVFTNQNGDYTLESIEPTAYTGRPPHIHVKVYAPSGEELLTTQMYFAGSEGSSEVTNAPELFVNYLEEEGSLRVLFNMVVNY